MTSVAVRFGAIVPQGWTMDLVDVEGSIEKYETMTACAREAEQAGFDSIWLYDHLHTVPVPVSEPVFVLSSHPTKSQRARRTHEAPSCVLRAAAQLRNGRRA
jgi:alkanesulfonate monooxygenase SsuD/methylene tetrahydromethanopterin reductase-like flavin-dependent oxidoreductase (luciferase family)